MMIDAAMSKLPVTQIKQIASTLIFVVALVLSGVSTANAQDYDWLVNTGDVGFDPVPAGSVIEYTVKVDNAAFVTAPATTVTVAIPADAEFIGATGTITNCLPASLVGPGSVTCDVPALAVSGSADMIFNVQSSVSGVLVISASVPVANDSDVSNNVEPEETTVNSGSDLGLILTVPPTASSGSFIDVEIEITNNGPDTADSFEVYFPVPTGLDNITPPAGCTVSVNVYTCLVSGPLLNGGATTLTFNGQVITASGSTITSSASVINSNPGDGNSANNDDNGNTAISAGSDVAISKNRSPSGDILVGDTVTFTLGASYSGDVPTGLEILDSIPANYSIDSITAPGWVCSFVLQDVSCTSAAGTVAGANVSLGSVVIETTAISEGDPQNTATITSDSPNDLNTDNNTASDGGATILVPTVDLVARKTGPDPALAVVNDNDPTVYYLSTRNEGTAGFFGTLEMVDSVPAGMTIDSVDENGWSCATLPAVGPTTFTCEIVYTELSPLASGGTAPVVTASATMTSPGTLVNGLTAGSPNPNIDDSDLDNNDSSHEIFVVIPSESADVGTTKTASSASVIAGDPISFDLMISNSGPSAAVNVEVTDSLTGLINNAVGPTDAGLVSIVQNSIADTMGVSCTSIANGGSGRYLTCDIPSLAICSSAADCPVITVTVRPGGNAGERTNTFSAISQDTPDPELDDNSNDVDFNVTARADMTVTKTANPDPVAVGQNLTYVISAQNIANGMSEAENVTITDTLPDNMTFVSATPSTGSCSTVPAVGSVTSGSQLICELGTIDNGAQQTVVVVVRPNLVTRNTNIDNSVSVATTTPEVDYDNNTDDVSVAAANPILDLLVNKTDSVDPLIIGGQTVYTVTVENDGPSAAENVVATDLMPTTNLAYISHVVSGAGTCSTVPAVNSLGETLTCSWPYLASGAIETIEITAEGVQKGTGQNNVSISSDEILAGFDTNEPNNSTSEITTVRTRTDIEVVSKIPSITPVHLEENFTFTVLLRVNENASLGYAEADGVVFSDNLPTGMILTGPPVATVGLGTASLNSCSGVAGDTSFICGFGTVSLGGEINIVIPVEITEVSDGDPIVNTARVTTTSFDDQPDNNENTGEVDVDSSSIAGIVFRDFNDDHMISGATDTRVEDVEITLNGVSNDGREITRIINTNGSGEFYFPYLPEGEYTITREVVLEPYLVDGTNTPGSEGGNVVSSLIIDSITLPPTTDAIDYLFPLIPQARVGIAKDAASPVVMNDDGSFNATFNLVVENFSLETLINMTVSDPLSGGSPLFGSYQSLTTPATDPLGFGEYTVLSQPTGSCGGLETNFNGSGNNDLATGFSLISGDSCSISFSIRVRPSSPVPPVLASGGWYDNQATVTGEGEDSGQTPATNDDLRDVSDDGVDPDPNDNGNGGDDGEDTPTPVIPNIAPNIALIKTADISALSTPPAVDDIITYNFEITNTGNITLNNITLDDDLMDINILGGPTISSLAPGGVDTTTFTATYALKIDDLNAHEVVNQATVTGTDPFGTEVTDDSGTANDNDTPTTTTLVQNPQIALIKTADLSALSTPAVEGETITYHFRVENTGNVTLTNITLLDPLPGIVLTPGPIASLDPGEWDDTTFVGTYDLVEGDMIAAEVVNQATVTGVPPEGDDVFDDSGTTNDDDDPTVTQVPQDPSINVVKSQVFVDDGDGFDGVGDVINYTITVENDGNVPLSNLTLVDTLTDFDDGALSLDGLIQFDNASEGSAEGVLAVGEIATYTVSYTLDLQAVNARGVRNTVTGTAEPDYGPVAEIDDVSDDDDDFDGNTEDDPTEYPLSPGIATNTLILTKTTPVSIVQRGAVIPYTITIRNDATYVAGPIDIVDTLPAGMIYVSDSATINSAAAIVEVNGAVVTWPNVSIPALSEIVVTLNGRILNGARSGNLVNSVNLIDPITGDAVVDPATAVVTIQPEAVFDCGDVIGKVFDDRNGNGYQDPEDRDAITDQTYYGGKGGKLDIAPLPDGEPGIPGVRLATVDGMVITTDEFGRFSVPCAMLPENIGSNFILKLDTRSLPSGFTITTENPRVVRLTPGLMTELNFGATLGHVARVDINGTGFDQNGAPIDALRAGIGQLAQSLPDNRTTVIITYHVAMDADAISIAQARQRLELIRNELNDVWRDVGRGSLPIQTLIAREVQQ